MRIIRKKFVAFMITLVAVFALVNITIRLSNIIQFFPDVNISYLLAEELIETTKDCSENGQDSDSLELLFLAKQEYDIKNQKLSNSVISFFHGIQIPSHPYIDKVIPPPKG